MDKVQRGKITAAVIVFLTLTCPLMYLFGWLEPVLEPVTKAVSVLACPVNSRLTMHTQPYTDLELRRDPSNRNRTRFDLECVGTNGERVRNNADMILGSICGLPFLALMAWGFASPFLQKKMGKRTGRKKAKTNERERI